MLHTCSTLQGIGFWSTDRCCQACHSGEATMCPGMDTYRWVHGERAYLCCSAYWHFYGSRHDPYDETLSSYIVDNGGIPI